MNLAQGYERRFGAALAVSIVVHLGAMTLALPARRVLPFDLPAALSVRLVQEPVAFVSEPPQPARPETTKPARTRHARPKHQEAPPVLAKAPQTPAPVETIQAAPVIGDPANAPEPVAPPPIEPSLPTTPEPVAVLAPAPAPRAPSAELLALYTKNLSELFARYKEYPRIAEVRGWEGSVTMRLRVAPSGRLIAAELYKSSGYDALDKQAITMVTRAGVLPLPPEGAAEIPVLVPINFRLER